MAAPQLVILDDCLDDDLPETLSEFDCESDGDLYDESYEESTSASDSESGGESATDSAEDVDVLNCDELDRRLFCGTCHGLLGEPVTGGDGSRCCRACWERQQREQRDQRLALDAPRLWMQEQMAAALQQLVLMRATLLSMHPSPESLELTLPALRLQPAVQPMAIESGRTRAPPKRFLRSCFDQAWNARHLLFALLLLFLGARLLGKFAFDVDEPSGFQMVARGLGKICDEYHPFRRR